ncbi:hypothetical protein BCR32DRAFT_280343 [Anaeromyces robustus]|uniref:Uncharacterized protein n=1 Tax=Anaeromyces robustus TaxID=1754192 RepID=A0A1Y1X4L4_9FUNG|nr:hypothetical protein BCR32DRAFT_280343 [Anaeromyces robustus]|eukprot:ORX80642.1 hypothetical protein BCR32DRAFT_280343 [Anaeromyces robustus]
MALSKYKNKTSGSITSNIGKKVSNIEIKKLYEKFIENDDRQSDFEDCESITRKLESVITCTVAYTERYSKSLLVYNLIIMMENCIINLIEKFIVKSDATTKEINESFQLTNVLSYSDGWDKTETFQVTVKGSSCQELVALPLFLTEFCSSLNEKKNPYINTLLLEKELEPNCFITLKSDKNSFGLLPTGELARIICLIKFLQI